MQPNMYPVTVNFLGSSPGISGTFAMWGTTQVMIKEFKTCKQAKTAWLLQQMHFDLTLSFC